MGHFPAESDFGRSGPEVGFEEVEPPPLPGALNKLQ
jgi:hypothetical protein